MKKIVVGIFAIFVLISFSRCALRQTPNSMSTFLAPNFDDYKVYRTLVLPFAGNNEQEKKQVTKKFMEAIQTTRRFEVVPYNKSYTRIDHQDICKKFTISASKLLQLAQAYNVQGIIRGRITASSMYPNIIGIKAELLSTYNGEILWAADGLFKDTDFYSLEYKDISQSVTMVSRNSFVSNACYRIAQTLARGRNIPVIDKTISVGD